MGRHKEGVDSFGSERASVFSLASYATIHGFHPLGFCLVIALHLAVIAAPWYVDWRAIFAAIVLFILTGELGINVGYHRLLAHSSFRPPRWLKRTFAALGSLSLQGGPITWVSMHRFHHRESDGALDPHTPSVSFLWAEFLWVFFDHPNFLDLKSKISFARDLNRDPVIRFIERWHAASNLLLFAILAIVGASLDGTRGAIAWVIWAGAVRIVAIWHLTFIVNAVNHLWGYRNYKTNDNSRNNLWISILVCFGEGWHNNHHAVPRSAAHGHRWFEFDLAFLTILILEKIGLAKNVQRPPRFPYPENFSPKGGVYP